MIRRIQRLSTEKLSELNNLLGSIENQLKSKDETLRLAGTWKDLDDDFLNDLTVKLHDNRTNDRQID